MSPYKRTIEEDCARYYGGKRNHKDIIQFLKLNYIFGEMAI